MRCFIWIIILCSGYVYGQNCKNYFTEITKFDFLYVEQRFNSFKIDPSLHKGTLLVPKSRKISDIHTQIIVYDNYIKQEHQTRFESYTKEVRIPVMNILKKYVDDL